MTRYDHGSPTIHIEHINVHVDTDLKSVNQSLKWKIERLEAELDDERDKCAALRRELQISKVLHKQQREQADQIRTLANKFNAKLGKVVPYPQEQWRELDKAIQSDCVQLPAVAE